MVELTWGGHQIAAIAGRPRAEDVLANPDDAGVVAAAAAAIGTDLARLVNAMDPDAVVIGGGLGLEPSFRDQVTSAALPLIYAGSTRELAVVPAALGRDAGIIGAALAAASSINGLAT
jgi:glucokinase